MSEKLEPIYEKMTGMNSGNVARKLPDWKYELDLEPGFEGSLMLFLHGATVSTVVIIDLRLRSYEWFKLDNGTWIVYFPHKYKDNQESYQYLINLLGCTVRLLEAFPVKAKLHRP